MIAAVDIGNSNVVVGVHDGTSWIHFWRMATMTSQDAQVFYEVEIHNRIFESRLDINKISGVILSTVVPSIKETVAAVLESNFNQPVVIVGPDLYKTLGHRVPRPYEIGTDLVANSYAAFRRLKQACIVVDFGTALTFTTVDHTGYILGVSIAPGIKTAMKALSSNTAQLPEIPLELPTSVLGLHTTHAIQAGILWGYVGMVKEMLIKIRTEVGEDYKAIATGGLSFVMSQVEDLFEEIDQELTLDGLRFMLEDL